jgi:hypothetical protein
VNVFLDLLGSVLERPLEFSLVVLKLRLIHDEPTAPKTDGHTRNPTNLRMGRILLSVFFRNVYFAANR